MRFEVVEIVAEAAVIPTQGQGINQRPCMPLVVRDELYPRPGKHARTAIPTFVSDETTTSIQSDRPQLASPGLSENREKVPRNRRQSTTHDAHPPRTAVICVPLKTNMIIVCIRHISSPGDPTQCQKIPFHASRIDVLSPIPYRNAVSNQPLYPRNVSPMYDDSAHACVIGYI